MYLSHVLTALRAYVTGNVTFVKKVLIAQTAHRDAQAHRRLVVLGTLSARLTQIVAKGLLARQKAAAGS